MKITHALFVTLAFLATTPAARAESFEKLDGDAYRHPGSGWVFPQRVGDFERSVEPLFSGSAGDGVANYQDGFKNNATVYIYSPQSDAADASYAGAKAVIEEGLKKRVLSQAWSEGPFLVGKSVPLVGDKIFYKIGLGAASSHSYLYHFDTGPWIVKVRVSGPTADKEVFQRIDTFVRELPWDSLGSSAANCSGVACQTDRPLAVHGSLIETIAVLTVTQKVPRVFPKKAPPCDAAAIAAALDAQSLEQSSGEPMRLGNSACTVSKGVNASFFRLTLSQDVPVSELGSGPDGLSLRGPISFVAIATGKSSVLTHLRDGKLDAQAVSAILATAAEDQGLAFAKGTAEGKNWQLASRFLEGAGSQ